METQQKGRRFSQSQVQQMEKFFAVNPYPSRNEVQDLATKLNAGFNSVRNWFNRRRRIKRRCGSIIKTSKYLNVCVL